MYRYIYIYLENPLLCLFPSPPSLLLFCWKSLSFWGSSTFPGIRILFCFGQFGRVRMGDALIWRPISAKLARSGPFPTSWSLPPTVRPLCTLCAQDDILDLVQEVEVIEADPWLISTGTCDGMQLVEQLAGPKALHIMLRRRLVFYLDRSPIATHCSSTVTAVYWSLLTRGGLCRFYFSISHIAVC